jgi:cell division protein FtsB
VVFARLRPYLPTALLALLIFYFGVNALTGERGLLHGQRREATLTEQVRKLKALRAEREELQTEVRLLSDDNLSRDLLEEKARTMLGFADPSDYVIRNQ